MTADLLDSDRLFSAEPVQRGIARDLYNNIKDLPIISPHGHTDPAWFAGNDCFTDASSLFLVPDHYLFRMLYSQGVSLESLGVPRVDGGWVETDMRKIWHTFATNYHLFQGTPSSLWMNYVFYEVFGMTEVFSAATADDFFDQINSQLSTDAFRPRALLDRFNIEVIATTEGAVDELPHHRVIVGTPWAKRVITTFRPDDAVDPEREDFFEHSLHLLGAVSGGPRDQRVRAGDDDIRLRSSLCSCQTG